MKRGITLYSFLPEEFKFELFPFEYDVSLIYKISCVQIIKNNNHTLVQILSGNYVQALNYTWVL